MTCPTNYSKMEEEILHSEDDINMQFRNLAMLYQTTERKAIFTNSTQKLTNARGNDIQ